MKSKILLTFVLIIIISAMNKTEFSLPKREGKPPKVGKATPQLQFSDKSPRDIYQKLYDWMFSTFPKVRKEQTRISVPSSTAMWLDEGEKVAHNDAFMPPPGSREFAHIHLDGSVHVVVETNVEDEIINKNWGVRHPLYFNYGVKEMLVYAPRNEDELKVLKKIIHKSHEYASGVVLEMESKNNNNLKN